jgi:hypothetical protein
MVTSCAAPSIGFIILSHEKDTKLSRLIAALNREYDAPPIVVHHDLSQADRDICEFPHNVRFVRPSLRTGWAKWSVVDGALRGLRMLFEHDGPDWFFLLSAADYPIMRGSAVRTELGTTACDAFIDARPIEPSIRPRAKIIGEYNQKLSHFAAEDNRALKWRLMCGLQIWLPIIRLKPRLRPGKFTFRPNVEGRHPFSNTFGCFYGDHWFTGNRRAAQALLEPSATNVRLQAHLRHRTQADESYYATMLANAHGLTLCRNNRRFAEWNGGGAHPIILSEREIAEGLTSGAFFARKMPDDDRLAQLIDTYLGKLEFDGDKAKDISTQ